MPRPILDERMTIRLPETMLGLVLAAAGRRNCSANDIVLNALENDFARIACFASDFYRDILPLLGSPQGDNAGRCRL